MFRRALLAAAFVASAIIPQTLGQTVQQDWTFPINPNDSTNVTIGSTYTVSWTSNLQNWFGQYCSNCNTSNVDLWVTGADSSQYQYKVATALDIAHYETLVWTVNIPSSALASETTWVLRFIPAGAASPSSTNGQQISSPLFYVNAPASASSTTSSSTTSSSATATTPTTLQTNTNTATLYPSNPTDSPVVQSKSSLSTGASVGIGVGVGLAALLLIALAFVYCCARRRRRSSQGAGQPGPYVARVHPRRFAWFGGGGGGDDDGVPAVAPQWHGRHSGWQITHQAAAEPYDGGHGGGGYAVEKTGGYGHSMVAGGGQGGDGGAAVGVKDGAKAPVTGAAYEMVGEREPGELPAWGNEPWRTERAELDGRPLSP